MNQQLLNHLGGSINREEHKGNFVTARDLATTELERVRKQGDQTSLADAQNYLRNLSEGETKIELGKLRHVLQGAHVEASEAPQSAALGRHVGEDEPTISAGYSRPYHWAAFILVGGSNDSKNAVTPILD